MSRWLRIRVLADRALAALALGLASPCIAALCLLVRRDGGPGLITVPRVGRNGEPFGMWKIRSMRVLTADGRAGGPGLTTGGDDRITPIGRKIRALHLDELPQLLNVVRGDMCLLGPRPEAPEYVRGAETRWMQVLSVPPGIAGPTQLVVGDWELDRITATDDEEDYLVTVLPVKLSIDAWYVSNATLRLDLLILAALARRVLTGAAPTRLLDVVRSVVPEAQQVITWMEAQ